MIDPESLAARFRARMIDVSDQRVLIADIRNSIEATDPYTIVNCGGFGRIREFREYKIYLERAVYPERPLRPNFRGHAPSAVIRSQVFQLAACNWRCWYCFVDDDRLSASKRVSSFKSAAELFDLYEAEPIQLDIIDLSGGQPDLVPEWTLWMTEEARKRRLSEQLFFWIDDNLSNDYLFRYLSAPQIARIAEMPRLSRMGCFKGFDGASFSFTTQAPEAHFDTQLEVARRIIAAGFEFYAYATFTCPSARELAVKMRKFVDNLQSIHEVLPLRTTPLMIKKFAAAKTRLDQSREASLDYQVVAFQHWDYEIQRRFTIEERLKRPDQIPMRLPHI